MTFFQEPPALGNQFDEDVLLREYFDRALPDDMRREIEPELRSMGELSSTTLLELGSSARKEEPELVAFDAWGRRRDEIRVPDAWRKLARLSTEWGLVSIGYERRHGAHSRIHQFALAYLFAPSSLVYSCPLAMTDGAARTLEQHHPAVLYDRVFPRLVSRDPAFAWTSGQWMTERRGGSDVGQTETVARSDADGFRLFGSKWFTSATTSEMALTLARPEGNPAGGKGLALFFVEMRDASGALNQIVIRRLKDKLGTRQLPTAELELVGTRAELVAGLSDGVKAIAPMLQITRTWNAVCAVGAMRRGLALARDYARRRVAFGAALSDKPLHIETLASLSAEFESAFLLLFRAIELLGKVELREASDAEAALVRLLQPIVKLYTAKLAVAHTSEVLELFGGQGYIEDTGLPALLRDTQVLPIWEGTTNVLALDVERALLSPAALEALESELKRLANQPVSPALWGIADRARAAADRALEWFRSVVAAPEQLEAQARKLAFALARSYALLLLVEHAEWQLRVTGNPRSAAAAARLSSEPIAIPSADYDLDAARTLAFPIG